MIRVRGARAHNLKSIDLDLPRNRIVVLIGPSGSGKSSLLFDLIHREGLRRFVEAQGGALSRWFGVESAVDVDEIEGLPPTLALRPRAAAASSRSSVGTLSETAPLLRRLFSAFGEVRCSQCRRLLKAWSSSEAARDALERFAGERVRLLASAARMGLQGAQWRAQAQAAGFVRMRWGGEDRDLSLWSSETTLPSDAMVVVDRLRIEEGQLSRLRDSLDTALSLGRGAMEIESEKENRQAYTTTAHCPDHGEGIRQLLPSLFSSNHPDGACRDCGGSGWIEKEELCSSCGGDGLDLRSDAVSLSGMTYRQVNRLDLESALVWLNSASPQEERLRPLWEPPAATLRGRLLQLCDLGLGHLQLGRRGDALSGGELLRVRLAAQLGAKVTGILIAAEEPLAGLHPRDAERVWKQLIHLRDQGNSVMVVEHQTMAIERADDLVELGPVGGSAGGYLLFSGTRKEWERAENSVTRPLLENPLRVPRLLSHLSGESVILRGAKGRNLKGVDLELPLGALSVVSGVSGSGKSTLVMETLAPALQQILNPRRGNKKPLLFDSLEGAEKIGFIRLLRQGELSGSRSMVATALGVWDPLRTLLSQTSEARLRGWSAGRFSLNIKGGRCERCKGEGVLRLDPEALPDLWVECPSCAGERFEPSTLEIEVKGKNAAALLRLEVSEALRLFRQWPAISPLLSAMSDVGLGYLTLGQSVETLSAGEGQRLRLAAELGKTLSLRSRGAGKPGLYLLDEPARGLHVSEVEMLLRIFRRLTDAGNAVLLVEHREELLYAADHLIELGPGGGPNGGQVI